MKPAPMPLFNYRKRERQAIVSDPQKDSVSNTVIHESSANNFITKTNANTDSCTSWNFPSTNSPRYSSSSSFNASKSPHSTGSSKNTVCFSKAPPLMNHQAGVMNRRNVTAASPSPKANSAGPSGFQRGGNSNNSVRNTNSNSFAANESLNDFNSRIGNSRGRGTGRASKKGGPSHFVGYDDNFFEDESTTSVNNCTAGRANSCSSNDIINEGFSTNSCGRNSSFTHSSASGGYGGTQSLMQSWSNNGSGSSFNQKHSNSSTMNKPKVVKLQSGNVQAQFGMANNRSQINKRGGLNHSNSFDSRQISTIRQGSDASNAPGSIFDEEDVAMQPAKYQKTSSHPLDTSLRIFTCPIRDVQSWSEAGFYPGTILFEIYGLIISGPTDTNNGVGKEFYLRDQSATIRCVFYEIDREIPSIMKGQVHRVVGCIVMKQGGCDGIGNSYLKVVSLRKADKMERVACQKGTELSLNEMDKLACRFGKEQ